ncbi:ABC transporter substrate-binding protein [Alicyclobacillus sp. SO9]|uniref:ABC transporter substrate-binding protein n=1 Tax=Alicyclobacillus sp. SO9 TaxID=2665646 RepID=UPI0018E7A894|nr:ABC transporter substrate-binding protein [Alicyclobacillus sp. SO9]QQE79684.1 ABC transporter substrate-binding protein [Alicyclobacillus sp. SO9]
MNEIRKWTVGSIVVFGTTALVVGCGTPPKRSANATANTTGQSTPSANVKNTTYPLTIKDEAGHTRTIPKQPHHIASTTEGTDEILSALVPKKDVAMVTTYATNPAYSNVIHWAKGITAIQKANASQILAVHPDLVLAASYTKAGVVSQLTQAGVPVFEFTQFHSISGIEKNIKLTGKLVGAQPRAQRLVAKMNTDLAKIQTAVKRKEKPTVLDYSSYGFAAGKGTTVNSIIVDAGGVNAAAKVKGWNKITDEEIIKMNPQVIITANSDKRFANKLLHDSKLQTVRAVKNHRVYAVSGASLSSVSQYIIKGVKDVAHVLHPSVSLPTITFTKNE